MLVWGCKLNWPYLLASAATRVLPVLLPSDRRSELGGAHPIQGNALHSKSTRWRLVIKVEFNYYVILMYHISHGKDMEAAWESEITSGGIVFSISASKSYIKLTMIMIWSGKGQKIGIHLIGFLISALQQALNGMNNHLLKNSHILWFVAYTNRILSIYNMFNT